MKKEKGFTLVELIAVIGITAIFGAVVLAISVTSGKLFSMTQTESVFNDEARLIISTFEEDLRVGKDIEITPISLYGDMDITINGINMGKCKDIGLPEGPFDRILSIKVRGDLYYYIKVGDRIERKKFGGAAFKSDVSGIEKIKDIEITKDSSVPSDKRYFINIQFENDNGEITEYSSAVMPRN